jgi:hypothetical protein
MDCCDTNSTFSYSSVNANAEEDAKSTEEQRGAITPLQDILDKKDLDAAAACLAFAGMLERTGCIEQADFFYDKMRSIVAQYASMLPMSEARKPE